MLDKYLENVNLHNIDVIKETFLLGLFFCFVDCSVFIYFGCLDPVYKNSNLEFSIGVEHVAVRLVNVK